MTCMCYNKFFNNIYIGNLGGYILSYNIKAGCVAEVIRYHKETPIYCLESYYGEHTSANPYLFVASASENYEVSLFGIDNKKLVMLLSSVERQKYPIEIPILLKEESIYHKPYSLWLQHYMNDVLIDLSTINLYDWKYKWINRHNIISNSYASENVIRKLICPQVYLPESRALGFPILLSAGTDKKIRLWNLKNINGIILNDSLDSSALMTNYKTFGDMAVILEEPLSAKALQARLQSKGGDTLVSQWRGLNGFSLNNERLAQSSHIDSITDMVYMENQFGRSLITCSKDGLVKIWK